MLRFSVASILITATSIFRSERQCSVFGAFFGVFAKMNGYAPFSKPFFTSKVGGLNRLDWVDMLRFRHICHYVSIRS